MASLSSLISGQPKERVNGFTVTMVHYSKLIPSENNNYSTENIEELARAILLSGGIKQNLLARKKSPDEYELIAGHRRRLAIKYLVEKMGMESYAMVPVHVEKDGDVLSEINLILANCSMRERTDWEKMMEVTRLTELVKALQAGTEEEQERFRKLFGKEPSLNGRELRKMVAESLGLSETRVANLKHIDSSLVPELKERFQMGEIGVSVANEAAGLPVKEQMELSKKDKIQLADVRKKIVSESDTEGFPAEKEAGAHKSGQDLLSVQEDVKENAMKPMGASPEQQKGPLSAHGTHRKVYPEGSRIALDGCESIPDGFKCGYTCFSCARECGIRQEERYCVEAPLGNPFPCDQMDIFGTLREAVGDSCQFVNLGLAYHHAGDDEPVPCCKECREGCRFRCSRAKAPVPEEPGPEPDLTQPEMIIPKSETKAKVARVENYDRDLLLQMISDAECEMKTMGEYWIQSGPKYYTRKTMEIQAYKNLLAEHDAEEAAASGLSENPTPKQPVLPVLKNDDQRKEWLKNYKLWGLWYRDEYIDVNYYKFDFDNGSRLVAAEFPDREWNWGSRRSDWVFYHLIEKGKRKSDSILTYDDKYQYHSTCESEIVKYLKKIQQKGRDKE